MADRLGFLRKSPPDDRQSYFEARGINVPSNFDWSSRGRAKEFIASILDRISELTDREQETINAELDLLASLANNDGDLALNRICKGANIAVDNFEGVEGRLLFLAVHHPNLIDRIAAQMSMFKKTGGRYWSTFQITGETPRWQLNTQVFRDVFLKSATSILNVPENRRCEMDWFTSLGFDLISGQEIKLIHANIYIEDQSENMLAFGQSNSVERRLVPRLSEIGIVCNTKDGSLDVFAKGNKDVRDSFANTFVQHFAPNAEKLIEAPRRNVLLHKLQTPIAFITNLADGISHVELSALDFRSDCGAYNKHEKRDEDEDIYGYLSRRFGEKSPLTSAGWIIIGAQIRIKLESTEKRRKRTLTVNLRLPNRTTMPYKTEQDWHLAQRLLERWGLLEPIEANAEQDTAV